MVTAGCPHVLTKSTRMESGQRRYDLTNVRMTIADTEPSQPAITTEDDETIITIPVPQNFGTDPAPAHRSRNDRLKRL